MISKKQKIGLVLAVSPSYSETFFRSKINGLKSAGHDVVLYVQQASPDFELCEVQKGPKVYSQGLLQGLAMLGTLFLLLPNLGRVLTFWKLERRSGKSVIKILKNTYLNAHILKANLDWLHFGFATMALERENLAKAIGAKMAVSFRGYDLNVYPIKHPDCYRNLWAQVDKVHSISHYLLQKAYSLGLDTKTPFHIITPAVAMETLPKLKETAEFHDPLQLVTVARLHWIKGLDVAIKAMQLLKEKGIAFHYKIIGEGSKKEQERYAYMAFALGMEKEIQFMGKLNHEETLREVNEGDIYLQPSLNEGFCNAVLEAQALGKICVASRVGGLPENILDGETGYLFEGGNPEDLAAVLQKVMALPLSVRKEMGRRAKERIESAFTIGQQQARFLEFYKEKE